MGEFAAAASQVAHGASFLRVRRVLRFNRGPTALISCRLRRALTLCLILTGMSAAALAQELPPAPSNDAADQPATPSPRPELYYLPDAEGKLVPVPGFTWEEFAELLEIQRRELPTAPPRVVLDQVRMEGRVDGDRALLQVNIDANLSGADWTPTPLRLDHAIVQEYEAEGGELRLEPAQDGAGYLAWLRAERAGAVRLKLRIIKGLGRGGNEGQLTLALPRATRTELQLHVPASQLHARIPEDEGLLTTAPAEDGGTLISVQASADVLHLDWSVAAAEPSAATLEVTGQHIVQLDAEGISTEAKLLLRSSTRPIELVHVRLPHGAQLLPERQASYSVELATSPAADGAGVAVVRLHEPNTVADVRIQTRQDWPSKAERVDIAGFSVVDASRQRGFVALRTAEDVRAQWEERALVRQVDELPVSLRDPQPAAGFEYSGQPFSLLVGVSPRVTRVAVEPQYLVTVSSTQLVLKGRLRCRVRDGSLRRLAIDLRDWKLDEQSLGPAGLIADDDFAQSNAGESFVIPFLRPVTGEFELRFEARRALAPGADHVAFALPAPQAASVGLAQLVVQAEDNVRLTPLAEQELKLEQQRPDPGVNLPALRQPPQFYRGDVAQSRFEAALEVRAREVRAGLAAQAKWTERGIEVRERIKFQVANEPIERIRLMSPPLGDALRLTLDGPDQTPLNWPSDGSSSTAPGAVFLPRPMLGEFIVEARFELPWTPGAPVSLPIIRPADAIDAGCELELSPPPGARAELPTSDWQSSDGAMPAGGGIWTARRTPAQVAITLTDDRGGAPDRDIVERAWIQTQLVGDQRQERVVWRVVAPDGEVKIRLPAGATARDTLATFDGAAYSVEADAQGNLVLTWPARADRYAAHVIELDYHLESAGDTTRRELSPPRLASPGWMKQSRWEMSLPSDEHLLAASAGYELEAAWRWRHGYWSRVPTWSSEELRRWSGAAPRAELPSASNRYLLSTFGAPEQFLLRSAPRSGFVLASSTALLAVGLLTMFAPARFRSVALLVLGLAFAAGLSLVGDAALLLLQAAAPGLLAMTVAIGLHAWRHPRGQPRMILQGSTHAQRGSSRWEFTPAGAAPSSHASRKAPVQVSMGDPP